jgi:methylphosphotriester-DNA--protein-cysteine methyltransferase
MDSSDSLQRFVRECQIAAAAWIPPTDALAITLAVMKILRSVPDPIHRDALPTVCRVLQAVARHVGVSIERVSSHRNCQQSTIWATAACTCLVSTHEPIGACSIACELGLSRSYLSLCFRSATGERLVSCAAALQLVKTLTPLGDDRRSIAEVARDAGYPYTSDLDRALRRWIHMTPTTFRKYSFPVD